MLFLSESLYFHRPVLEDPTSSTHRPGMRVDETDNATIAPGPTPSNRDTPDDINTFHVAHAHALEEALRKTTKQIGVTLEGELHECKGCSMTKGIRMSIPFKTDNRED